MKMKSKLPYIPWMMLALMALCFGSCKDDNESGAEFDPSKPVVVSEFSPEKGGIGTQILIKGDNFGTDISKIKVTIGGISANVMGSDGTTIYCMVPGKASEGTVEVKILDAGNEEVTKVTAKEKFNYIKKMLVTTLLGEKNEKGDYDDIDGPFDHCGGIRRASWLTFDPQNPNHLYLIGDEGAPFRLIDFDKKWLSTKFGNNTNGLDRMRTMTWTLGGDMIMATDKGGDSDQSNTVLSRSKNFMDAEVLVKSRQCNGSAIHPDNGELYYNSYGMGKVFRYDFDTKESKELFSIQDINWEFTIQIHPSGDYAYIVVINQNYILRTDYDRSKKTFTTPYIICGWPSRDGSWVDGVGTRARLGGPYQGAFVKNEEYVEAGEVDEYDFYFCERGNHCIRTLTPNGKVTTFAGRGSSGVNNDAQGYIDGDLRLEARFDGPEGLAYDEVNKIFYIGDRENRRIRKIAYEED